MTHLEQELTDHLHRRAANVIARYDLEAVESGIGSIDSIRRDDRPNRRPLIGALALAAAAAAVVGVAMFAARNPDDRTTTVASSIAPAPTVGTSLAPPASGGMWPQSSVDEVRAAQELADAGDPAYDWQVDPHLSSHTWWEYLRDPTPEIVERFLSEELGWDQFLFNSYVGDDGDGAADGVIRGIVYLRCAPGETNPLYPDATGPDALGAERCAPTIDELRYETVSLDLTQPERRGRDGIWVVSRWTTIAPFSQRDPHIVEAQTTARLQEFLQARIDGAGAEGYVEVDGTPALDEVPLMYTTSTGARYERYEIDVLSEPRWPYGSTGFTIRLFADEGETVVEQPISWMDSDFSLEAAGTTENGQPVPIRYHFFDGHVTASVAGPWQVSMADLETLTQGDRQDGRIQLVRDPFPLMGGCERGPTPADAAALDRAIGADPNLVATAPKLVSIGGVVAVARDVTLAPRASTCQQAGSALVLTSDSPAIHAYAASLDLDHGSRMRLYLLDLPEGSEARILAIAVVAPEARFDAAVETATPIIESIEFHMD